MVHPYAHYAPPELSILRLGRPLALLVLPEHPILTVVRSLPMTVLHAMLVLTAMLLPLPAWCALLAPIVAPAAASLCSPIARPARTTRCSTPQAPTSACRVPLVLTVLVPVVPFTETAARAHTILQSTARVLTAVAIALLVLSIRMLVNLPAAFVLQGHSTRVQDLPLLPRAFLARQASTALSLVLSTRVPAVAVLQAHSPMYLGCPIVLFVPTLVAVPKHVP